MWKKFEPNFYLLQEWYDFNANYSRMDFKSPPTGNDSVDITISPQTIINDFNTGMYTYCTS